MRNLYEEAVNRFGKRHQIWVAIEEMGECIASMSQFYNRDRGTEQEVIEEVADVCIMMEQMRVVYGDRVDLAIKKKLLKLEGLLDGDRVDLAIKKKLLKLEGLLDGK